MESGLKKILYVEDDELIAELAIMALEEFGEFDVRHCISGAEALDTIGDFKPDLILLDVMMPQMDGMETLRRLWELPQGAGTPAVFMSAKVQTHERDAYIAAGACGVIAKPFDPIALSDMLIQLYEEA